MSKHVKEVSAADFETEVLKSDLPVVVDFGAPWCGPCKYMIPIVDAAAEKYVGKVKFVKVNVDDEKVLTRRYNISGIPHFLGLRSGIKVDERVGSMLQEKFEEFVNSLL